VDRVLLERARSQTHGQGARDYSRQFKRYKRLRRGVPVFDASLRLGHNNIQDRMSDRAESIKAHLHAALTIAARCADLVQPLARLFTALVFR